MGAAVAAPPAAAAGLVAAGLVMEIAGLVMVIVMAGLAAVAGLVAAAAAGLVKVSSLRVQCSRLFERQVSEERAHGKGFMFCKSTSCSLRK
jgi:hypothetical protein